MLTRPSARVQGVGRAPRRGRWGYSERRRITGWLASRGLVVTHRFIPSLHYSPTIQQMTWTVLIWNMGMGAPSSRSDRRTWDRLSELIDEWSVDVALLNEASTSILRDADGAVYEVWGTRGRDRKRRDWSTAVLSRHGLAEIRDAQAVSYRGRRPNVRFENSRPGSWIAASVRIPKVVDVTCVSLYGLTDELSEASVHRSLSELSPLFSDPRYGERLLLGGDLNTSTQWPKGRLALVPPVGPIEPAGATGAGDRDAVEGRVARHLERERVMPPIAYGADVHLDYFTPSYERDHHTPPHGYCQDRRRLPGAVHTGPQAASANAMN